MRMPRYQKRLFTTDPSIKEPRNELMRNCCILIVDTAR